METIISIFLIVLGLYFGLGLLFALYVVFLGATKLDPLMQETRKLVRLLVFPGIVATWPVLLSKLIRQNR